MYIYFTVPRDQSSSNHFDEADDYNESLIAAVQARRPLYDHRIPVKERSALKKKALWNEVIRVLGGMYSYLQLNIIRKVLCYLLFYLFVIFLNYRKRRECRVGPEAMETAAWHVHKSETKRICSEWIGSTSLQKLETGISVVRADEVSRRCDGKINVCIYIFSTYLLARFEIVNIVFLILQNYFQFDHRYQLQRAWCWYRWTSSVSELQQCGHGLVSGTWTIACLKPIDTDDIPIDVTDCTFAGSTFAGSNWRTTGSKT